MTKKFKEIKRGTGNQLKIITMTLRCSFVMFVTALCFLFPFRIEMAEQQEYKINTIIKKMGLRVRT